MEDRNISTGFLGWLRANKWLVAFILTAIALVVAIVVAVVIGTSTPTPPEYNEGDEIGVYYFDVADGEMQLTLSGGNRFTLVGPQINKTGTYTVDADGNVVLDFIRDEDGTADAKLDGNNISLDYNNAKMEFVKKINYTVNFNSNGGSAVDKVTVINGKTVAKPKDPTKDGYVFLGWYTDEALKEAFDFTSKTVTQDTTLYARWIENPVGGGKYTVDFDLGYADAPAIDEVVTINGVLPYGAPTPADREGYTFAGWWISAYESASKLSYKYTADTVFTCNTTLYAVWVENGDSSKLTPAMPSINGSAISWEPVNGALSYKITIVAPDGTAVVDNETVGSTTKSFDFAAGKPGEYKVTVVAVAANEENNSEPATSYVANKTLGKVSVFNVIDGILIYNAVDNADTYYVTVDCGNDAHSHTLFNNGQNTSFSIANCPMQAGGIKIIVTAEGNGYASSVSETYVYERTLAAIEEIVYNKDTDSFVWDAVENVKYYSVTVKVGDKSYVYNNGTKTAFSIAGYTGDVTVTVVPVNEGFNSPAATTATANKNAPATPTGITVVGNTLTWNASEGATSYEVKIGAITRTTNTNSLDLSAENFANGIEYEISVKAIKGAESSAFSEAVLFGYRKIAGDLTYKNNTVYWTPAIGASKYVVRVNGDDNTAISVNDASSAKIVLTKEGVNTVEVKFIDEGGCDWVSLEVTAYAVTYMPRNTETPITEYLAIGDAMALPKHYTYAGFTLADWYTSPAGAAGNGAAYTEGSLFNATGSLVLYAEWTPVTYNVTIQTEGYEINDLVDKTNYPATYTKYFTLPVPVSSNPAFTNFAGWFTGPQGSGDKLTDSEGRSVGNYAYTRDSIAYPFFDTGILTFILKADNTYSVTQGPNIGAVSNVTVPNTYNGRPVTTVLEDAFYNCKTLVTVNIPDTIKLVGVDAFYGCTALTDINVYEVEGNHEIFYFSDQGALLRKDSGMMSLEVFPRAKTGEYVMSDDVQIIISKAFYYSNIDSIVIGKGVTNISKYGFYYCKALESIDFAEGRTASLNIENYGFYGCSKVESFKIPVTLALPNDEISAVLRRFSNLAVIEIEEGNTAYSIKDGLLANNDGNEIIYCPVTRSGEITIPSGVQTICAEAFYGCSNLTSIVIPAFVRTIGNEAFYNCTAVTSVTFNAGRRNDLTIGDNAFAGMKVLRTVTFAATEDGSLDSGVITIGTSAFAPSTASGVIPALTSVTFGNGVNVAVIGDYAFANQTKLSSIVYGETAAIEKIGSYAFSGNSAIESIEVPSTTSEVGSYAFADCSNVKTITLVEGATLTLGDYAFANCEKLKTINLPSTVRDFNGSAFDGCESLAEIVVADGNPTLKSDEYGILYKTIDGKVSLLFYPRAIVRANNGVVNNISAEAVEISSSVFENIQTLTEITIGKNVAVIGDRAFYNCSKLKKVTFEAGAAADATLTIGNQSFAGCESLKSGGFPNRNPFTLPSYTTAIGDGAFEACTFVGFTIPENVTSIGAGAFKDNKSLTSIVIPENVTFIGNYAFAGCEAMTSFKVNSPETDAKDLTLGTFGAESPVAKDGVFNGCTELATVDLGNRVTSIGDYAFSGLKKLSTLDLGDRLTVIGKYAFRNSTITKIEIPNTVVSIMDYAFAGENASKPGVITSLTFEMGGTDELSIGAFAFAFQDVLKKITFPDRLAYLYEEEIKGTITYKNVADRFSGMKALESIEIYDDPATTGTAKFASREGVLYELNEEGVATNLLYCPQANPGTNGVITIPNYVTLVENGAFAEVTKLTTIKFENFAEDHENYGQPILKLGTGTYSSASTSTTYTKYAVLGGTSTNSITKIELPSHLAYIGYMGISRTKSDVDLTFHEDTPAIDLAQYAFYYSKAKSINIPKVANLDIYVFYECASATSITFEKDDMTVIPTYTFAYCDKLQSYTIPATVREIEGRAFLQCIGLETVDFSACKDLTTIGDYAFSSCSSLNNVDLSGCKNLTTLGTGVFNACTSFTSFTFPESVETVGASFLAGCTSLTEVTLNKLFSPIMLAPDGDFPMFDDCTSLQKFNVPKGNFYFTTDEFGVLYDLNKTIVYFCPPSVAAEYVIPDTVIRINDYAFQFYKGTTLELPDLVEYVGSYAFYQSNLETLYIPSSVKTIGSYAFYQNQNLKTFTFAPNGTLETIGISAFYECKKLESINIPDSVTFIDRGAFYKCEALKELIVPASLETFGSTTPIASYSAFAYLYSLEKLVLQEGLKSITPYAFYYAGNKNGGVEISITIPSTVEAINSYAFQYATGITSITFAPDCVLKTIDSYAFQYLKLESLVLPSKLESINASAFRGNSALKYIEFTGTSLKALPANLLSGCTSLETVILNEGLTTIGNGVFSKYEGSLRDGNLDSCISLKSIVIPSTVVSIGNDVFNGCTGLETVTFAPGSSITALGTSATEASNIFGGCTSLKSITLPDSVEFIGAGVFANTALESINIPASLTTIGNEAFMNCTGLTEFELTETVTYIGDYAFYGCSNLVEATPKDGLEYFGALAFGYCEKLNRAYIPATVTKIAANPYVGCYSTSTIELDPDNLNYEYDDGILYGNEGTMIIYVQEAHGDYVIADNIIEVSAGAFAGTDITSITFPEKLRDIQPSTFENCTSLTSVVIDTGIKSIGDRAFSGCTSLNNVFVPATVDEIGNYAFAGCTALSNFSFEDKSALSNPYLIGTNMFDGCTSMTSVILPNRWEVTEEDYKASTGTTVAADRIVNIPSYMFANTGIVHAVLPEEVKDFSTRGVFMNCKALEDLSFEAESLDIKFIGDYYFYGCSSIKTLDFSKNTSESSPFDSLNAHSFAYCTSLESFTYHILSGDGLIALLADSNPINHFEGCTNLKSVEIYEYISFADVATDETITRRSELRYFYFKGMYKDCTSLKEFSFSQKCSVAAGMFEGSGLETLTITPASINAAAFKDCTGIKNAFLYPYRYEGLSTGTIRPTATVYKSKLFANIFDGWTSDQNIYILSMTRAEFMDLIEEGLKDTTPGATYDEIFAGCDANVYFVDDIKNMDVINLGGLSNYPDPELFENCAASEIIIGKIARGVEFTEGMFKGLTENQTIKFTGNGYDELYKYVNLSVLDGCEAKILDKDGNSLTVDREKGVIYVKDAANDVIALYVELPFFAEEEDDGEDDELPGIIGPVRPRLAIKDPIIIDPGIGGGDEEESGEGIDTESSKSLLESLNLSSYPNLKAIYFINANFIDVASVIGDAAEFNAFKNLANDAKIYDMDGNEITVNDNGCIDTVILNNYYLEVNKPTGGGLIKLGKDIALNMYNYDFSKLGAGITVNIGGEYTYADVAYMVKKYSNNIKDNYTDLKISMVDNFGNEMFFDDEGQVVKVVDSLGNTIYEKTAGDEDDGGDIGGGGLVPDLPIVGPVIPGPVRPFP